MRTGAAHRRLNLPGCPRLPARPRDSALRAAT
jgi:hypothetical protein